MVVRTKDSQGYYIQFIYELSEVFENVQLRSAYFAKRFPEQFDEVRITGDEEDLFLDKVRVVGLQIASYLKEKGLDRQGYILDTAKDYIIGADRPNEKLQNETDSQLIFSIRDNRNVSDSQLEVLSDGIEKWAVSALVDVMLDANVYKGELAPMPLAESFDSQIFYLTLK